jgi:proton-dependent oligopeptide transporter, POT family
MALAAIDVTEKTFLGHPKGLFLLFGVEMWERFSFYGMRALLIFYLTKHWLFAKGDASVIYGTYLALVYITPVVGGYIADRYLGQRKAVQFGAILLTIGHGLMVFEGVGGQDDPGINVFWLALAFIIAGVGFLKANISTIVGQLYARTDPRRDPAYTIFYMGINLGGALGPIIAGYLGETYGWSYGFGAAGIGMFLGWLSFTFGRPLLMGKGEAPDPIKLASPVMGVKLEWLIYAFGLVLIGICWWLIQHHEVVGGLLGVSGAILVGYILFTSVTKMAAEDRDRIFAALFLIFMSILFWALFEQAGSSLNLFTDTHVDRHMLGIEVPASIFQSLNSIYIVLLAPVVAIIWTWLGKRRLEPSAPAKFGIALIQLGIGFLILVAGAAAAGPGQLTPVIFIFLIYLLHTTAELCLSPVGLSAMNRLSPLNMASLMMGTWFFATSTGNFAAGLIAGVIGAEGAGPEKVMEVYSRAGWVAVGVGVLVIAISPLFKRLMHLDTMRDAASA